MDGNKRSLIEKKKKRRNYCEKLAGGGRPQYKSEIKWNISLATVRF